MTSQPTHLHLYAASLALLSAPDTTPVLTEAWTRASADFSRWLDARYGKLLADETRDRIAERFQRFTTAMNETIREDALEPLREALVAQIENTLKESLSPARLAAIEAGADPEDTLSIDAVLPKPPADVSKN